MLLARRGYRVLVVDQATFPSERIATHMVWPPGAAALRRWGIWDEVAAGNPALCRTSLSTFPGAVLRTPWHTVDGVDFTFNMRRIKLDDILVRAARTAGAEVREGVQVEDLLFDDERVVGILGREVRTGVRVEERARIVVGADGRNTVVGRKVRATTYDDTPPLTASYLMYVEDFPIDRDVDEVHTRPPREYVLLPTDDGLTVVNVVIARHLLDEFRRDVTASFYAAYDLEPELGPRLRASRPVSRVMGVIDLPNFYRRPYGDGWALVGDAGHHRDPIRAQGMHSAFLDAESLAAAIDGGFSGPDDPITRLRAYEEERNTRTATQYRVCLSAARFELPSEEDWAALQAIFRDHAAAAAEFRGITCGSMRPKDFYARWAPRSNEGSPAA